MNLRDTRARIRIKDASSTELKQRVKALGLNPEGKSMKELEVLISMAQFAKEHPNEEFPDQFDPMLAKESSKASKDWVDKLYKSSDYIIQSKVNGMRSVLRISENGDVRMTSRSKSVKDFTFTPHQDNVLGFQSVRSPFSGKTVFDGELRSPIDKLDTGSTIAETPLQCVVALVHMNTPDSLKNTKRSRFVGLLCI